MANNPFLKYIMKDEKEDIFHTSAYGKAQNGQGMGAASSQSFAERRQTDANRTVIRGFNSSSIAGSAIGNGPRAKAYVPPAKPAATARPAMSRPPMPKNPGISR